MEHIALYRQARPKQFSEVMGQDGTVEAITSSIVGGKLPRSILLSGRYGCGKTTIARLIAASVNCTGRPSDSAEPCGDCNTCIGVIEGEPSLAVQEMDAAKHGSVDAVRTLIESMQYLVPAKHKVYIIDEAHCLSKDAASALLKTLEEPPEGVIIIMATTDPERLKETIRSRLSNYSLASFDDQALTALIKRSAEKFGIELSDEEVESIKSHSNNSARDALNELERRAQGGASTRESIIPFLDGVTDALGSGDAGSVILLLEGRISDGDAPDSLLGVLIAHFNSAIVAAQAPDMVLGAEAQAGAARRAAEKLPLRTLFAAVNALLGASRPNSPYAKIALQTAILGVLNKGQAKEKSSAMSDEDINVIVSEVTARVSAVIESALASAAPAATEPPVATKAKVEAAIEQDDREQDDPEDEDKASESEVADDSSDEDAEPGPFGAKEFLAKIRSASGLSRLGEELLSSAKLALSDDDETVIIDTGKRGLPDDDWDIVAGVIKSLGYDLEEA